MPVRERSIASIVSIDRYLTQLDTHENTSRSLDTHHLLLILYLVAARLHHRKCFRGRHSFTDVSVRITSAKKRGTAQKRAVSYPQN